MLPHLLRKRKETPPMFTCKCGATFKLRRYLTEHVGLLNPRWPRTSPTDEHAATTKDAECPSSKTKSFSSSSAISCSA